MVPLKSNEAHTNFHFVWAISRVSLGERLQHEESSGVVRSTGSTLGEKEITFTVKKVGRFMFPLYSSILVPFLLILPKLFRARFVTQPNFLCDFLM